MKVTVDVQTDTIIADRIVGYLESSHKAVDSQILQETMTRMRHVIVKDLMQPRETRAGKESNTLYTGPCARKARLTFDGAERDPLRARTILKFLLGDLVEHSLLTIAQLAGCPITENNCDLTIQGEDGVAVPVHPDGYFMENGTAYNIEIKSCDSRTFDAWLAHGGPTDEWGYLTQASVEIQAWREYGRPVDATIFLAVSTGSRQGSIAEWVVPFDASLVRQWHARRAQVHRQELPVIPFASEPEMQFMRGKAANADWFTFGEPTPRTNEKGAVYGWDVLTGRQIVPLPCSYCDFRAKHCWETAVMELDGTKPIWVVPA